MSKFVFLAIGVLFLIAIVFTLIQYLVIILLKRKEERGKRKEEENTEKPKEE